MIANEKVKRAAKVHQSLLFPGLDSFSDCFVAFSEHRAKVGYSDSAYCWVEPKGKYISGWAVPTPVIAAKTRPIDGNDTVSYRVIEWPKEQIALVLASHSVALIDEWIALIDPTTLPRRQE